jgi:hypothetical protein
MIRLSPSPLLGLSQPLVVDRLDDLEIDVVHLASSAGGHFCLSPVPVG